MSIDARVRLIPKPVETPPASALQAPCTFWAVVGAGVRHCVDVAKDHWALGPGSSTSGNVRRTDGPVVAMKGRYAPLCSNTKRETTEIPAWRGLVKLSVVSPR